jgi:hypothetical protein
MSAGGAVSAGAAGESEPEEAGEQSCVILSVEGQSLGRRRLEVGQWYENHGMARLLSGWAGTFMLTVRDMACVPGLPGVTNRPTSVATEKIVV